MKENSFFPEINGNFGYGFMRVPVVEGKVDYDKTCKMVDTYLESGFNYFDTAHGYMDKLSEPTLRECLTKRYPREKFVLADKLSGSFFNSEADIRPFFASQLEECGVDYFDFYLMHAQGAENYGHYCECKAYETAFELKAEGKIKHVGISFHDSAEFLDKILTDYPELEFVQLQFNYADFDDERVQSKKCYDVCVKHSKPVIVMEPVKGGHLVNLPQTAKSVFDALGTENSYASYAVRFAAGFENVALVLSGMSYIEQVIDNVSVMSDYKPLNEKEAAAVKTVSEILKNKDIIKCTACRYCVDGCPAGIAIPDIFACCNAKIAFNDDGQNEKYKEICEANGSCAADCLDCGSCESACPQHLEIRELLRKASEIFD